MQAEAMRETALAATLEQVLVEWRHARWCGLGFPLRRPYCLPLHFELQLHVLCAQTEIGHHVAAESHDSLLVHGQLCTLHDHRAKVLQYLTHAREAAAVGIVIRPPHARSSIAPRGHVPTV
eukprot:6767873-Prymnesium_polylepis.1